VAAVFPLAWVSPEWLEFDTAEGTTRTVKVSHDMVARDRRQLDPRCAAGPAPGRCVTILNPHNHVFAHVTGLT
jgi:hypothetical protein